MVTLTKDEQAVAAKWAELQKAKESADKLYAKTRRITDELKRLAKLGRKKQITVRIGEITGVHIVNHFQGENAVFFKGFAKKIEVKQVKMDSAP